MVDSQTSAVGTVAAYPREIASSDPAPPTETDRRVEVQKPKPDPEFVTDGRTFFVCK